MPNFLPLWDEENEPVLLLFGPKEVDGNLEADWCMFLRPATEGEVLILDEDERQGRFICPRTVTENEDAYDLLGGRITLHGTTHPE